ncbi:hypothetical protein HK096_000846, partial [Nowakowskiella sp. JEL0078]
MWKSDLHCWWSKLNEMVKDFVKSCDECQRATKKKLSECGWRNLRQALIKWCNANGKLWHKYFRHAIWADNITIRESTGYEPFTLWYGHEYPWSIEFKFDTWERSQWTYPMDIKDILQLRIDQLA